MEDIEAFSSCNKRVRLLFGPVLRLHMERKREYSKLIIGIGIGIGIPTRDHVAMFIRDLCGNPAIAHYPTELVLGDYVRGLWECTRRYHPSSVEQKMGIMDAIDQFTDKSSTEFDNFPYIKKSDEQDWKSDIAGGDEGAAVAFLITLLPNLNSITISGIKRYPGHLVRVVSKIAAAQRETPNSFHPLKKLTRVHFERMTRSYGDCYGLLISFRKLRSVRILSGEKIVSTSEEEDDYEDDDDDEEEDNDDDDDEADDEDRDQDEDEDEDESEDVNRTKTNDGNKNQDCEDESKHEGKPKFEAIESGGNITRVRFENSSIGAKSFFEILKGINALRHFSYSYNVHSIDDGTPEWEPAGILRSLLLYAGHSLVTLSLIGDKGSWNLRVGDDPNFANSPRHFKVLKELCVQDGIFVKVDIFPWSHKESGGPNEMFSWNVHRMVDILPPSLERLTLFPSFQDSRHLCAAIEAFPELKESRLPRLTDIRLATFLHIDESVKLACMRVGTSVIQSDIRLSDIQRLDLSAQM